MSTLTVTNISNGSVTTTTANVVNGSAKAWAKFNGSGGVSGITSYNVSSITRSANAQYTISFTSALTDGNYVIAGSASDLTPGYCWGISPAPFTGTMTGSTAYIETWQANQANDRTNIQVVFFR